MMKYDVIIVGAGPAGVFAAYEFMAKAPNLKILLIDKGKSIYNRKCPINEHKIEKCPIIDGKSGCKPACSITNGFGGAGAFSDGKFNITTEYGGWLTDYLDDNIVIDLINYVDSIYVKYGAPEEITDPNTNHVREIERRAIAVGLKLLRGKVRHLGTENNLKIQERIFEDLKKNNIDMLFEQDVMDVLVNDNSIKGIKLKNGDEILSDNVILGVGRDGASWLEDICKELKIKMTNNQVDIGVRVETNDIVMEEINNTLYEGKFLYRTSVGTVVRTFCSNPSGHVVVENHSGTMLANGHAYYDKNLGSTNTNFALLVSHKFSDPFDLPNEYAHQVARLANELSCGSIIVQRYGDITRGRRTTQKRIDEGFVKPTLKEAVPGDLGLVLPYNTMKSIIEMIEALDHVTPGIANEHTLFYGVEAKFYSARPEIDKNFQTKIKGLYVAGDGAGLTRGLAQAGANGVYIARKIIEK